MQKNFLYFELHRSKCYFFQIKIFFFIFYDLNDQIQKNYLKQHLKCRI